MNQQLIATIYSDTKENLTALNKKRKSTFFFQKLMWIISGLYFILMLSNFLINYLQLYNIHVFQFLNKLQSTNDNPYGNLFPIIGLFIILYPTAYVFGNQFQKYKVMEAEIIKTMVHRLFPTIEFSLNTLVPKKQILKSKLFSWTKENTSIYSYGQLRKSESNNIINVADIGITENNISNKFKLLFAKIPVVNLLFIIYEYAIKNILITKSSDNLHYTFRGMFCWLSFKKSLQGHTVVLSKHQGMKFNRSLSFNFKQEEEIKLEDPRFKKHFIVFGTNQIEARYILSLAFMEKIVQLKERFNRPINISFHHKEVFISVENRNGLFSFQQNEINSIKVVEELALDIETALEINSELVLN